MSYKLEFHELALKEWHKFGSPIQRQFKTKLKQRLLNPHVPADQLSRSKNRYKIKLRSAGFRLVYSVNEAQIVVKVIAVGKRERNSVYKTATKRKE